MKIIELRTENFKRIRVVAIKPDAASGMVVIGGENAAGKSSLLDAIEVALGGAGAIPPEPIRRGARHARIVLDLGDIVVERTFSAKGTQLVVKNADGVPQKSPQALLDALCSKVAFDPLSFSRMEPKKQDEVLKKVLGLDFSELDGQRARAYQERTEVNRRAKEIEAKLEGTPDYEGVPAAEFSVSALMHELDRRVALERKSEDLARAAKSAERAVEINEELVAEKQALIAELEQRLADARELLKSAQSYLQSKRAEAQAAAVARDAHAYPDPTEIRQQLTTVEETNRKVRANVERKILATKFDQQEAKSRQLSDRITQIDEQKAERLAGADFPVPGLGFDERGPTLNGIPLEQASQAERLRVSVAIGLALNPQLKVLLVRDGSLLDDSSMRLLAEMAAAAGAQCWVERVGRGDPTAVVLEDGEIAQETAAAE